MIVQAQVVVETLREVRWVQLLRVPLTMKRQRELSSAFELTP
jgi:hypothetical protein